MKRYIIPIVGIVAMTLFVAFWYLEKRVDNQDATVAPKSERQIACEEFLTVALFQDDGSAETFMEACLRGDPVLPDDLEDIPPQSVGESPEPLPPGPYIGAGCAVGGCSQQICGEAGEVENIATTCEWRAEYACYAASRCEKQASGQCGWTNTAEQSQCLADAASSEEEVIY